jgi:hypothetical protein
MMVAGEEKRVCSHDEVLEVDGDTIGSALNRHAAIRLPLAVDRLIPFYTTITSNIKHRRFIVKKKKEVRKEWMCGLQQVCKLADT